jgi:hypothetical protein
MLQAAHNNYYEADRPYNWAVIGDGQLEDQDLTTNKTVGNKAGCGSGCILQAYWGST